MIKNETLQRFDWHAGLVDNPPAIAESAESISSSTWPLGHVPPGFHQAVTDCITALIELNKELNPVPWDSPLGGDLPRKLVYSMSEITRMIRDSLDAAPNGEVKNVFARAVWRIETAWSQVLAGDIGDLKEYLEMAEAARFE